MLERESRCIMGTGSRLLQMQPRRVPNARNDAVAVPVAVPVRGVTAREKPPRRGGSPGPVSGQVEGREVRGSVGGKMKRPDEKRGQRKTEELETANGKRVGRLGGQGRKRSEEDAVVVPGRTVTPRAPSTASAGDCN